MRTRPRVAADASDADGDVAEICIADVFSCRQIFGHAHERLIGIELLQNAEERGVVKFAGGLSVARREDAAVHGNKVRREDDPHFSIRHIGEDLIDLGHVAVGANTVSGDALIAFGKMQVCFGFAAGTTDTALAIDDNSTRQNRAGSQ